MSGPATGQGEAGSGPDPADFVDVAREICEVGRRAWQRGFVAAWDGNISALVGEDLVLCSPTRCSKGFLRPEDLCLVDLEGRQVGGRRRATSEIRLHTLIYRESRGPAFPARAVVHLHPAHATAMAACHRVPPAGLLAETALYLGEVALVPYELTGTQAFADAARPFIDGRAAFLLANHGAATLGRDVEEAWAHMEILEQVCQVAILSEGLGGARLLPSSEVGRLAELRRGLYGLKTY